MKRLKRAGAACDILFFFTAFVFLWNRAGPALIILNQQPVFLAGRRYFEASVGNPGGYAGYVSAWLYRYFTTPAAGAAILVLLIASVSFFAALMIRRSAFRSPGRGWHLAPALFLVFAHGNYDFPLAATFGLALSLACCTALLGIRALRIGWRIPIYLVVFAGLYQAVAGPALLMILLSIGLDALHPRRSPAGIAAVIFLPAAAALLIPLVLNPAAVYTGLGHAYLRWMPFSLTYRIPAAFHLFVASLLLIILVPHIAGRFDPVLRNRIFSLSRSGPASLLPSLILLGLLFPGMGRAVDPAVRSGLVIRDLARRARWEDLLAEVRKHPDIDRVSAFHMHRALYHAGRLGDEMFRYPQHRGIDGFILLKEAALPVAIEASDLWFDLAHYNEAEHWAHEALTQAGETPRILSRIAEVNLIKGNRPMAEAAVGLLERARPAGGAVPYRDALNRMADPPPEHWIRQARDMCIDSDFLVHLNLPEMDLVSLVRRNPRNHMAYEYLMSYYLLVRQLDWFVRDIEGVRRFAYRRLPAHWEEALLVYGMQTGKTEWVRSGHPIRKETFERFRAYEEILNRHGGDRAAAHDALRRKFGGTYWYYLMYQETPMRQDTAQPIDGATGATR
ncbi:MAG TPA: hypothetical protein ENN17_04755 [bacterium]|nr:hypothetical protein [bacterium]